MDLDSSTSYQVSDALKDRHPFTRSNKPAASAVASGNGFGLVGLRDNVEVLKDDGASTARREQSLKQLLRQLSSCEAKVRLVGCGLLDGLKAVASPPTKLSAQCDRMACECLRQLAALPTSMHALAAEGCVALAVEVLEQQPDTAARLAACRALLQMSATWDGRALLLGLDLCEGLSTRAAQMDSSPEAQNHREELARRLVAALVALCGSRTDRTLLLAALQCLANVTTEERGLQYALCEEVFRDINAVLEELLQTGADEWVFDDSAIEVVFHAVTIVWNVALDDFGKDKATEITLVPYTLGKLLADAVKYPDRVSGVKAVIAGSLSALYVRAQTKATCLQPLHVPPQVENGFEVNVAYLLVKLLKQANALYQPMLQAKKKGQAHGKSEKEAEFLVNVVTNANQSIRLLSELPAGRKLVKRLLEGEPMELRRQIFYSTQFQAEFLGENFVPF